MLKLDCDQNNFFIKRTLENLQLIDIVNKPESPWIVVKHYKTQEGNFGYKLIEGDVIKMGRVKLKVYSIKLNSSNEDSKVNQTKHLNEAEIVKDNIILTNEDNLDFNILKPIKKSKNLCRICYCDEKEIESPLISPCHCSGTMKYIHFSCLQQWLKSKVVIKASTTENCTTYSLKQIECELCKTLLPDFIKYKEKTYEMWDFKNNFQSYIIFETLLTEKNANRVMYVINLENKENIKIGRGHDSDIRVTDISVSRFHAIIKKEKDGSFVLEDNNSKFGTLVLMQTPKFMIDETNPLPIQIGRSFLTFSIKKSFSLLSCICSSNNSKSSSKLISNRNDYQRINSEYINFENCNNIKIQNEIEYSEESFNESYNRVRNNINLDENNKEVFLKIIEIDDNLNNDNLEDDNNINNDDSSISNDIYNEIPLERNNNYGQNVINRQIQNVNMLIINESKNYLERANTNVDLIKKDEIKSKLENDLKELRKINNQVAETEAYFSNSPNKVDKQTVNKNKIEIDLNNEYKDI